MHADLEDQPEPGHCAHSSFEAENRLMNTPLAGGRCRIATVRVGRSRALYRAGSANVP